MKCARFLPAAAAAALVAAAIVELAPGASAYQTARTAPPSEASTPSSDELLHAELAYAQTRAWSADDFAALIAYRPGYEFWHHIFTIPDGSVAFGSATDGRLLAVFPTRGDWVREAEWHDPALSHLFEGRQLARGLDDRRDQVAAWIEQVVGPVVHNPTRGTFLLPNARRYGDFLRDWGAIYERFGVPGEVGLAQAIVESGLHPTRRSSARAIGFCQFLERNWRSLDRRSPHVLEAHNQTTQASYCAAYLVVLAAKYGSFIPALSEHHSGGTNVGRTLINGDRLGGEDIRDRYFLGSQFARDLRRISLYGYRELYRTYGPRSAAYSEMVFGNSLNVRSLIESTRQTRIYAMRTSRAIPTAEITRRTRLSVDDVRRFNPALLKRVPAGATLYLPMYVKEFGRDVAFWHRPPSPSFASVLSEFVRSGVAGEEWNDSAFEPVLRDFQERFRETGTEEGTVMSTVLGFAIDDAYLSRRSAILAEFRSDADTQQLFERGVAERTTGVAPTAAQAPEQEQQDNVGAAERSD